MTKIDIVSGFLGAGKTTLIKKLLEEALAGQQVVLIENEFGEIGIDGGFLRDAGIEIREMNSGCICCSLVGDFGEALAEVLRQYSPDRIIIEPSGVGKLSDVIRAVVDATANAEIELASYTTVCDASKVRLYMKNFGEFYDNQIESAKTIVLSRTQKVDEAVLDRAVELIREKNAEATIVTTPWDELTGEQLLRAMEEKSDFASRLLAEIEAMEPDDDDDDDDECECGHHHHDHDGHHHDHAHHEHGEEEHHHHEHDEDEEEHHHHEHDEDEEEHHHHEHDEDEEDDEECGCGHHHHHHHHGHHHADDVFTSWGTETHQKYSRKEIDEILTKMAEGSEFGVILRSKGIVACEDGTWIYFDMVPEETEIRTGDPDVTGRLCVIGTELHEDRIREAFRV